MPIYEYKCKNCEHVFERFQAVNDQPEKICPMCGGEVKRVFYPAGLIFKGSGFYITDSRKQTEKKDSQTSSESS